MLNALGFSNNAAFIAIAVFALIGASTRIREAIIVLLTVGNGALVVVGISLFRPHEHSSFLNAHIAVWGSIIALGVSAIVSDKISFSEVFSFSKAGQNPLLRVAIYFRLGLGAVWGLLLLTNAEAYIATVSPAVQQALRQPATLAITNYHGAQLLALVFVLFFLTRIADRRELTVVGGINISYIVVISNAMALFSTLPQDAFTVVIGFLQLVLLVVGILSNEGALEWAEGGFKSARNALLVVFFIGLISWITRHYAFAGALSAARTPEFWNSAVNGALLIAAHRLSGYLLVAGAIALIFGDDETVRGALGGEGIGVGYLVLISLA